MNPTSVANRLQKHPEPLFSLCKTLLTQRPDCNAGALLGSKNPLVGSLCALRIVEILDVFAIWATLSPLVRSKATSSHPFADFLHKTWKHWFPLRKTHICGGHLPRFITLLATLLVQNSHREPLSPPPRRLCGHCGQCKSSTFL